MHYGMIATGNHLNFNSLLGAPPSPTERKKRCGSFDALRLLRKTEGKRYRVARRALAASKKPGAN